MKPRSLRHRLERAAKVLVLIQKHTPEVECRLDEDKGEHGHIILDFAGTGMSRSKMTQLGRELESKGYRFTEKRSPWLGQTNYCGRASEKPTVVMTVPIVKDRVAITDGTSEQPCSFADS